MGIIRKTINAALAPFGYIVERLEVLEELRKRHRHRLAKVSEIDYRAPPISPPDATPRTDTPARHHCLITGTGRAGTSFLVQLLTRLGLHTGYTLDDLQLFDRARAGLERKLTDPKAPYIVKNPALDGSLADLLASGTVVIEHAIIPVRDMDAAVASRVAAQGDDQTLMPGGLWRTDNPFDQRAILADALTGQITALARHAVPITLLWYPRLARDPDYLYERLSPILGGIGRDVFGRAFEATVRPEWITSHTPSDR